MSGNEQALNGHHRPAEPMPDGKVLPETPGAYDRPGAAGGEPTMGPVTLAFLIAAIRRGTRLWCATAATGLLLGLGLFAALPPSYQASASVLLQLGPYENFNTAPEDNQAIAASRAVAGLALHKLGLRQSVSQFLEGYTVAIAAPDVLQITASAPSRADAVSRANAVAAAFLRFRSNELQAAQALAGSQAGNQAQLQTRLAVNRSRVLDAAASSGPSRLRLLLTYVGIGLLLGLVLGLGIVVVRAVMSDRLRQREDIARALGAPVRVSVGAVGRSRWLLGLHRLPGLGRLADPRGRAAVRGAQAQRIAAHLSDCVPEGLQGSAALAVIPVDSPGAAALCVAALAISRAQQGAQVVVADLCEGAPAARLLGAGEPGVGAVSACGARLTVAVPDKGDPIPLGPLGRASPRAQRSRFTAAVADACASADLLVTLATLDPALGGEHLATWAPSAVAVITAGRSSAVKIRAVGEMVRLGGANLVSAVLVGADKTDDSLGTACAPPQARWDKEIPGPPHGERTAPCESGRSRR